MGRSYKKIAEMTPEEFAVYQQAQMKRKERREQARLSSPSNPNPSNPNVLHVSQEDVPTPGTPPIEHKPGVAEREYFDFLQQTLGVSSLVLSLLVCYLISLPLDVAEELAFTQEEVLEISEPLSRILAKSKLPATTRRIITSSGDYVGVGVALTAYIIRILSVAEQQRGGHVATLKNPRVQSPASSTSAGAGATNGIGPVDIGALSAFGGYSN